MYTRMQAEIAATAYHELGHALLCRAVGAPVREVVVSQDGGGVCRHGASTYWQAACLSLGGPVAECRYSGHSFSALRRRGCFADDIATFNAMTEALARDDPQRRGACWFGDQALAYAERIVRINWPQLTRLASELQRCGRLDGSRFDLLEVQP